MTTFDEVIEESKQKEDDKDDLFAQWKKKPTPAGMRSIVKQYAPLIDSAVRHFVPNASPVLRQRANLIAANAVKSFDASRGASLKTHLYNHLRSIQRLAPAVQDPLPPPERFRAQQREISEAADIMMDQLGREPTDEEVAEALKLPLKRVTKVRGRMRSRMPWSVYEEAGDDSDDDRPDVVSETRTPRDDWYDAVYHDLGDIDRLIMMHRTGYRGAQELDNAAIAKRLGVSPAAVSQRARKIQDRLDQYYAITR